MSLGSISSEEEGLGIRVQQDKDAAHLPMISKPGSDGLVSAITAGRCMVLAA